MHYAISDIHGCYREFRSLLDQIAFSENDVLYVLGDLMDRGPDSIKVLEYMSFYPNMIPIMGNHDFLALQLLPLLNQAIEEENISEIQDAEFLAACMIWFREGGYLTSRQFKELSEDDQEFYLEYLEDFSAYEIVNVAGKTYILSHCISEGIKETSIENLELRELLEGRPDWKGDWKLDAIHIVGHTPTTLLHPTGEAKVYRKDNLIDIDCGCVFGGNLAAYCLETGEVVYQECIRE